MLLKYNNEFISLKPNFDISKIVRTFNSPNIKQNFDVSKIKLASVPKIKQALGFSRLKQTFDVSQKNGYFFTKCLKSVESFCLILSSFSRKHFFIS